MFTAYQVGIASYRSELRRIGQNIASYRMECVPVMPISWMFEYRRECVPVMPISWMF